jgi:RNA polymerase sigma-70 factor (ECF subfamily)
VQGKDAKEKMKTQSVSQSSSAMPSLGACKGYDESFEASLIAEAKTGSLTAFDQLVHGYETKLFRVAHSITHTLEDSEEVVQNALVKAFANLYRFRGDSRFYTWLVRIAINEALMQRRGRHLKVVSIDDRGRGDTEERTIIDGLKDHGPTPEERCWHEELQNILRACIGRLRPDYRSVFHLREVAGVSTEETAQALNLSPSAVKTRLRRARIILRDSLKGFGLPMEAISGRPKIPPS